MRAVLFDFDGVLVKSMEDHFQGWKLTLQEFGIEMYPEELYMLEGQGVQVVANQLGKKYNLPAEAVSQLVSKKKVYYEKIKKIQFYPNLLDVLNWNKERELKMAVVSGGQRERITETLDNYGLAQYFSAIVTSDDVMETKPSPEPYLKAATLLNISPENCVVVENAPLGIQSGKRAGMKVVAIATTLSPQYLKEADIVVDNFIELNETLKRIY